MIRWFISRNNQSTKNLLVKPLNGQVVCEIEPTAEAETNARLIAAAPDLLVLAEQYLSDVQHQIKYIEQNRDNDVTVDTYDNYQDQIDHWFAIKVDIENVIAKAKEI